MNTKIKPMTTKVFSRQLLLVTALTALAIIILARYPLYHAHQALYWALLGFFFLTAVALFGFGKKLIAAKNRNSFTLFVMGATFVKIFLSMGILVVYLKYAEPASKLFIMPFLGVYLIFAVFETLFLMKIGRGQPNP